MALLGILEVEQTAGFYARPARQPHQVVLVIVAQQQRVGHRRQVGQAGTPGGAVGHRLLIGCRPAARRRQIPFRQQHCGIDQRLAGIGAQPRQQRAPAGPLHHDQHVGGAPVELGLLAARRQHAREGIVAEVLQQQEAVVLVDGLNGGRAEAEPAEVPADAHEGPHVLLRRRRVHDHGRGAWPGQPEVFAERGVARQQALAGVTPAGAAHEICAQPVPFTHRQTVRPPADRRACPRPPWQASP
jgi:hypothetical protein